ncbi:DUF3040 domain-containing protein [Streptomyces sp. NPDC046203]|uniref:DUF3040 domain-containing protein n=1 Tax=Streptomyces sp. NPDC046203 TaxID=3154602 RepID=UPI003407E6E5
MDGSRLSPRERRILDEIEHDLAEDASLARLLGAPAPEAPRHGGRPRRRSSFRRPVRPTAVAVVLTPVVLALLVVAVVTGAPGLVWAFAAVWALSLVLLTRLLLRWSRRHFTGDERPRPDQGEIR